MLKFATTTSVIFFVANSLSVADPVDLFVAANGDDLHSGKSTQSAFATIERAREEIRNIKAAGKYPDGGIAVEILGGKYSLKKSLEFSAADSGTFNSPVVYRAYHNETVQILGGKVLKLADFAPVVDSKILSRLGPAARGQVISAPLAKLGLKHAGPFPPVFNDSGGIFELFWNGKRLPLSRWPNSPDPKDWATMKKAVVNGDAKTGGTFEYREERPSRWLENHSVWLKGQWRVPWEDPAIRVEKIDPTNHQITFAAGIPLGIGNKYTRPFGNGKEPWCALNLMKRLINRVNGRLISTRRPCFSGRRARTES